MDEQNYQKPRIIEYLLGSLSVAETEKFDELSFTDDEFAGALDAAEKELIDGYVRGELGGATLEKFQTYYLESPLRRKKVEFAETFQIYNERETAKNSANLIAAESGKKKNISIFSAFSSIFNNRNRLPLLGFGFAALLMAVGGLWLFKQNRNRQTVETAQSNSPTIPKSETNQSGANQLIIPSVVPSVVPNNENTAKQNDKLPPISEKETTKKIQPPRPPEPEKAVAPAKIIVASFFLSPSLRGANQIKSFSIPKDTTEIKVNLELETDDFPIYRVALTDESGSVNLWRSGRIKAAAKGENKSLPVRFPAKLLKSKIYTLVVSGINAESKTEIISNYSFRSVLR